MEKVVVKTNKNGLSIVLDEQSSFNDIKTAIEKKFSESKKFFGNAMMAVSFEGKELTQSEEFELVGVIESNTDLKIPCVIDHDKEKEELMKKALERATSNKYVECVANSDGKFYKGTLRSGQVLDYNESIVVLGDVNPGSTVRSKGNVVILGALKGTVEVGVGGNEDAFVAALSMSPMQVRIADYIERNPNEGRKLLKTKKVDSEPMLAYVEDGNIYVEALTKDSINKIRL